MQEQAFLSAIVAAPDDPVPRLIYADWLDEQGDPRGEFIRVQCERETVPERDPRCVDLDFRERHLLAQYRNLWAKPVRKWGRVVGYRRGFVEDITLRTDAFLESGEELLATSPIRRVKLTHVKNLVPELAQSPLLSRLELLNLRDGKLGLARFRTFLKSRWIKSLQGLDLSFNGLAASALRELIASDNIGPIKSLALDSCKANGAVLQEFLDSPLVAQLEKLELRSNGITNDDVLRIARCSQLKPLKELSLDFNPDVTNAGMSALMQSRNLPALQVLSVRGCHIGREADWDSAFPVETTLQELVHLNLEELWIGGAAIRQLAETKWADQLVHLSLRENYAEASSFDQLFEAGRFPHLRSLWLSWNKIKSPLIGRLTELATSHLAVLDVGAHVENKGAKQLAQSEKFANLNVLNLRGAGITDAGARALANSKTLNRITELRLTTSPSEAVWSKSPGISAQVTQQLLQRFGKHACYFD